MRVKLTIRTMMIPAVLSLLVTLLVPVFVASPASAATDSCTPSGTTYGTDTLTLNVTSAGTYTIWTRMQIPDSADNAVLLKVGTSSCYNVGANSSLPTGSWQWVNYNDDSSANAISVSLSAGNNTLTYTGTFSGVEIDRVLAIQGTSCTPTGTGDNCTQVSPPSTPSGVVATANGPTSVTVNWNASTDSGGPGLGGYYVLRGGTQVGSVNASTTSYTDTTVVASTQYSYTVEAYDTATPANVSAQSAASIVTTPSGSQAPSVGLNSFPANTEVHGGSYTLNTTVTPTSGNTITQVQLLVGSTVAKTLTASPYNFTFSTLGYHDGSYTITVKATDNHSNIGTVTGSMIVTNGDLNNDNTVSLTDLSLLAGNWQKTNMTYGQGDIDGNGTVNITDLSLLAGNWGVHW